MIFLFQYYTINFNIVIIIGLQGHLPRGGTLHNLRLALTARLQASRLQAARPQAATKENERLKVVSLRML